MEHVLPDEGIPPPHLPAERFPRFARTIVKPLLNIVEVAAAVLLVADLVVVIVSVMSRYMAKNPFVWADDVARALLLAVSFLGAAAALARGENAGVTFCVDMLPPRRRQVADAIVAVIIVLVAVALCWNSVLLLKETRGQSVGAGMPQELFFVPIFFAAAAMVVFSVHDALLFSVRQLAIGVGLALIVALVWIAWSSLAPDSLPSMPIAML